MREDYWVKINHIATASLLVVASACAGLERLPGNAQANPWTQAQHLFQGRRMF